MHTGAQASAQVAGAGEHVAEVLVPHVLVALGLHARLHLGETLAEALEDGSDVAALLHGDDSGVVLLVHPDEEGLVVVVPVEWRKWLIFSTYIAYHHARCEVKRGVSISVHKRRGVSISVHKRLFFHTKAFCNVCHPCYKMIFKQYQRFLHHNLAPFSHLLF